MEKSVEGALRLLGAEPKEIKFLQASYKLGPASVIQIAKQAHLERSTAYLICDNLLTKQLLEVELNHYRKQVYAVSPQVILRLVAARQRQLRRQELELEESLPELLATYQKSQLVPKVRVFSGRHGLEMVMKDILQSQTEICLWTNQQTEGDIFSDSDHKEFIGERVKRNIPIRVLAVNNPAGFKLIEEDGQVFRRTRILPSSMTFSAETYIYDAKIAMVDFNKDIIGIIIESETIVSFHRAVFEAAWDGKIRNLSFRRKNQ